MGNNLIYSDNCGACGKECLNSDLEKVILSSSNWNLPLCRVCRDRDVLSDYKDVVRWFNNQVITDPVDDFRKALEITERYKMAFREPPRKLKEAASSLETEWKDQGVSVGTAFGLWTSKDDPKDAQWMLFAYAEDPDKMSSVMPMTYQGFRVLVRAIPVAR